MEYYYIDFKDEEVYSFQDIDSELDKANKLIGNYFTSFYEARNFLKNVLDKQSIDDEINCDDCNQIIQEENAIETTGNCFICSACETKRTIKNQNKYE